MLGSVEGWWAKKALKVEDPKHVSPSRLHSVARAFKSSSLLQHGQRTPKCGLLFDI